ncbi:hypothetical protein B9T21_09810 [Wohlfahrtiimonas chitiniclastica]|uniref:hypothetical protein n=1 Tax=Wohlfahrtiimonas chitiniclastica TaxID=400946 RepID=UPI000B98A111|nr:hypothetical protein [Wohlfahrtiimonas chitiniclastica]OYQ85906.1 hypothetical protein B9T21_09810 [Wohlfahrtiimonas chitiniclastica]
MVDQIIYKTKDDVLNAIRAIDSNKLTVGDLMEIIKKASAQPTFATNADTVFLLYSGSLDPNNPSDPLWKEVNQLTKDKQFVQVSQTPAGVVGSREFRGLLETAVKNELGLTNGMISTTDLDKIDARIQELLYGEQNGARLSYKKLDDISIDYKGGKLSGFGSFWDVVSGVIPPKNNRIQK